MTDPVYETIIDDICTAIVETLGSTIHGVTTAIDPPPPSLTTAQLPALWAFTGSATGDDELLGDNFTLTTRQIRVQVAVIPTGQGDPRTRETLCRPLLGAVLAMYRKHKNLAGVEWVQDVRVTGDSGIVVLPEYGGAFIGFEVRLEVQYVEPRAIVD